MCERERERNSGEQNGKSKRGGLKTANKKICLRKMSSATVSKTNGTLNSVTLKCVSGCGIFIFNFIFYKCAY